jgi:hypothetical protein
MSFGAGSVKLAWVIGVDLADAQGDQADYDGPLVNLMASDGCSIREATKAELNSFPGGADEERGVVIQKNNNIPATGTFGFGGDKVPGEAVEIQTTAFEFDFVAENVATANLNVLGSMPKSQKSTG